MIYDFEFWNNYLFLNVPTICEAPPTLYSVLQAIQNFGKVEKTSNMDLTRAVYKQVFDFNYNIDETAINKEEFEINILDHFLMRRLGSETFIAFKMNLRSKLNEILPKYNLMFKALKEYNLFDGKTLERELNSDTLINSTSKLNSKNVGKDKADRRMSELPQNKIQNIEDGSYMTNYVLEQGDNTSTSESSSTNQNNTGTKNIETIKETSVDKINDLIKYQREVNSIYTMLYKDLDCLFFQLSDY